jgi:glycosyltransferase involved in cell wall biosynthesis
VTNLHAVLPNDIDDPARPSGGNFYDRRLLDGLASHGWSVTEHRAYGDWPTPDPAARARLAALLAALPDGAPVLIDGLVASAVPELLVPQAARLRFVVLVHLPLAGDAEAAALGAACAIVATSGHTRDRLLALHPLPPDRVHVARPGVDRAEPAVPSPSGSRLLCVAAVSAHKGHDVLLQALAGLDGLPWTCRCVGSLTRDPDFVDALAQAVRGTGLAGRISFTGALTGAALDAAYADADLLVLPSRGETYGMVLTEALARAIPVLVSDVGGVREALGAELPGLLVPPEDPAALALALQEWLTDAASRAWLREAAVTRRRNLEDWWSTAGRVAHVLEVVTAVDGRQGCGREVA